MPTIIFLINGRLTFRFCTFDDMFDKLSKLKSDYTSVSIYEYIDIKVVHELDGIVDQEPTEDINRLIAKVKKDNARNYFMLTEVSPVKTTKMFIPYQPAKIKELKVVLAEYKENAKVNERLFCKYELDIGPFTELEVENLTKFDTDQLSYKRLMPETNYIECISRRSRLCDFTE